MATVRAVVVELTATTNRFEKAFGKAERIARGFVKSTRAISRDLDEIARYSRTAAIALTGLSVATGKIVKAAANHEESMLRVKAVSRATAAEYHALSKAAIDLSTTTRHSLASIGEGMTFLAMAGFQANEIIAMMPTVTKIATAGAIDMASAADITTNIIAGYGMQMEELARATDILVASFTGANVDLMMLGETFKHVGPIAKNAGIEFEQIAASAALLGNAGIQGSIAGTSLKSAISRLLGPSASAERALRRLGVQTTTSDGKLRDFTSIIADLSRAGATTADVLRIFGLRAGPAMARLIDLGADALEKYTDRLKNAEGIADLIEAEQMQSFNAQAQLTRNILNAWAADLGNDLLPYIKTLNHYIGRLVNGWRDMDQEQKNNILRTSAMVASILGLITAFGLVAGALSIVVKGFTTLGIIVSLATSVPVLAILGIAMAVGTLRKAWDEDWKGIRTTLTKAWRDHIMPTLTIFWSMLQRAWEFTVKIGEEVIEWIFNTDWAKVWQDIKSWFDETWSFVVNVGEGVADWLFNTTWAEKWEDIKSWIDAAWDWTINFGGDAWNWIKNNLPWFAAAVETVESALSTAWSWTINTVGDIWNDFRDGKLADWLEWVTNLKDKITEGGAWKWAIDTGKAAIEVVLEFSGDVYEALKTGDWETFWDLINSAWNKAVPIALGLSLAANAGAIILSKIGSIFSNPSGTLGVGGVPLAIGLLTVGLQLAEAQAEGSYEAFVKNVLVAALVGAIGGAIFGSNGALLGFTLALNFKLGEKVADLAYGISDKLGVPKSHYDELAEYQKYVDDAYKKAGITRWQRFLGKKPEDLMSFSSWQQMSEKQDRLIAVAEELAELLPDIGWTGIQEQALHQADLLGVAAVDIEKAVSDFVTHFARTQYAISALEDTLGVKFAEQTEKEIVRLLVITHREVAEKIVDFYGTSMSRLLEQLLPKVRLPGYAQGGYTGNHPVDQVVGVVHGQELVIPAWAVNRGLEGILSFLGVPGFKDGTDVRLFGGKVNLGNAEAIVDNMKELIDNLTDALLKGISKMFEILVKAIETIAIAFVGEEKAAEIKNKFLEFYEGIQDIIGFLDTSTRKPEETPPERDNWFIRLQDTIAELTASLAVFASDSVEKAWGWLEENLPKTADFLQGLGDAAVWLGEKFNVAGHAQSSFNSVMQQLNPVAQLFSALLSELSPTLETLLTPITLVAKALASALMPVLQALFPVFKFLGIVMLTVAEIVGTVWNTLLDLVSKIPFVDLRQYKVDINQLSDSKKELKNLTWDTAESMNELNESVSEATRNVPTGLKIQQYRLSAAGYTPGIQRLTSEPTHGEKYGVESSSDFYKIVIEGDVYGIDNVEKMIHETVTNISRQKRASEYGV